MAVRPFLSSTPLRALCRRDRRGLAIAISATLGVVTFTLVPGLLIAVAFSLDLSIADESRLRVSRLGRTPHESTYLAPERFPALSAPKGATILRPDG
jgi:MFS superfamily sulfate permease-like transporter